MTPTGHRAWTPNRFGALGRWIGAGLLLLLMLASVPPATGSAQPGAMIVAQAEPSETPDAQPLGEKPTEAPSPEPSAPPSAESEPSQVPSEPPPAAPSSLPSASEAPSAPPSETPAPSDSPVPQPSPLPTESTRPARPQTPVGGDEWVDTFEDPSAGLLGQTPPDQDRSRGQYEDGEYVMEIADPEVAADLIAPVRTPALVDVRIATEARLEGETSGRYVTAVCREIPDLGGYRVYLSPDDGYFAITRFVQGEVPAILQQGFHPLLAVGNAPFSFTFSCTSTTLELAVGDQVVGMVADNAYASGLISVGAGYFVGAPDGPIIARFSELTVQGTETSVTALQPGQSSAAEIAKAAPPMVPGDTPRFDPATGPR